MPRKKEYEPKISHTELQNAIVKFAKLKGWKCQYFWRNIHSPSGWPDLYLCRYPRTVVSELKVPPDRVKPAQQEWLDLLAMYPQNEVFVWYPDDWLSGKIEKILE